MLPPQKQKQAADRDLAGRLAGGIAALLGPEWHRLHYGVAVSGGPDSMALLWLMTSLLPGQTWAATVDHGLRKGSDDEARMVGGFCAREHIPHSTLRPPTPITGSQQAAARTERYRLWDAKLYPEAETQLKTVVEKWPKSSYASFAQNLLGRAYLDEGKPSLAAVAFYNNYKDRPSGPRAPHSLMYMGVALNKLGRKADACKAFRELDEVYGDKAPQDVRTDAAAAKAKAGC